MEIWDLFNEDRQLLNRTINRGQDMMKNEYHIGVNIWVINSKKDVLVTLRHPDKESYPNKWECTGGSILAGETSKEGAVRELKEETGINISENELIFLGSTKEECSSKPENLFTDVYILIKDVEIGTMQLQDKETIDARWITIHELNQMIDNKSIAKNVGKRLKSMYREFEKNINQIPN